MFRKSVLAAILAAMLWFNFGQDSSWIWDASVNYSHTKRDQRDTNEVDIPALQAAVDNGANIFN